MANSRFKVKKTFSKQELIMQIFIVNLEKSKDRRDYMEQLCNSKGIRATFITGVYGKDLSLDAVRDICNQDKAKAIIGRELLLGEIGCTLSHKNIYRRMVDENISEALVLEDDVYFEPFFQSAFASLRKRPKNSDLVLLGHHSGAGGQSLKSFWGAKRTEDFIYYRLADLGFGTYGYFITLEGAKKLLEALEEIYQPIDHYTCDSNILNVYAIEPTPIKFKNDVVSLIDKEKTRLKNTKVTVKLVLKSLRLLSLASILNKLRKKLKPIRCYK